MAWPSMFGDGQPTTVDPTEVAMSVVRDFCRWHVTPIITEDLVLDGSGKRTLLLPSKHVLNVTAVTENGTAVTVRWSAMGVLTKTGSDVMGYPLTVEGWLAPDDWLAWTADDRAISLTIEHGYAPEEVASVLGVVKSVAARVAMNPSGAITQQRAGTQGVSMLPGSVPLFASEKATLQRYRLDY
jgi:hypothetical protein